MDECSIPDNIPSEDSLGKRIDRASATLLSAKLPEEQAKDLAKNLKARYIKLLTTLEKEGGKGQLYNTQYHMTDKVSEIAFILLKDIQSPSTLEVADGIERAAMTLDLEPQDIDVMTVTKQVNRHLESRYIDYGGF